MASAIFRIMRVTNGPKKFKSYPIGFFHIDIAKVSTEGDKRHLFVAIDRTSKLVMAKLADKATMAERYKPFWKNL